MESPRNLLLISSSKTPDNPLWLDHCSAAIKQKLKDARVEKVLFVPYAVQDRRSYTQLARERFREMGFELESLSEAIDPVTVAGRGEAFFVGGGNTFLLAKRLQEFGIGYELRQQVLEKGAPYIGVSAGTNMACPTFQTTNDMPIVLPQSPHGLNLVDFQINPHYVDPPQISDAVRDALCTILPALKPILMSRGETRAQRIAEFHQHNERMVVGLREGAMLDIQGQTVLLKGSAGAKVFRRDQESKEYAPEVQLDFLGNAA